MRVVSSTFLWFVFLWTASSSWLSSCYALSSNTNSFTTTMSSSLSVKQQTLRDEEFHEWCHSVAGIQIHPSVELQTTVKSVAGRGVFTNEKLEEGEVVIVIPEPCVMHEQNAALYFPHVAHHLKQQRLKAIRSLTKKMEEEQEDEDEDESLVVTSSRSWWKQPFQRLVQKVRRRRRRTKPSHPDISTTNKDNDNNDLDIDSSDCIWQAELTSYAMACMMEESKEEEEHNIDPHPWKLWISQWQRDDVVYNLFRNNVRWNDEGCITQAAQQLNEQLKGGDTTYYKIRAAIQLRLKRFQDLQESYTNLQHPREKNGLEYNHQDDQTSFAVSPSSMYAILCSRAIELGDGITGVIPMFDMINHSLQPNLALMFDGEHFELFATRPIEAGEELFLCYTPNDQESSSDPSVWDEDEAVWSLVQWGIPNPKPS